MSSVFFFYFFIFLFFFLFFIFIFLKGKTQEEDKQKILKGSCFLYYSIHQRGLDPNKDRVHIVDRMIEESEFPLLFFSLVVISILLMVLFFGRKHLKVN